MELYIIDRQKLKKLFMRGMCLLILFAVIGFTSQNVISVMSISIKNAVIVIDAGHGGRDPGALGTQGAREEDINLAIALKLRRLIEQSGGIALMIREDDSGLYTEDKNRTTSRKSQDMRNRHSIINNSDAHLLVSIHLNSFPQTQYYGAQTFYQKGDDKGMKLAEIIQGELKNVLDKDNNRKPKPRNDVYILKNNSIPGALIECGFLSNPKEERLLMEDHYQEKVAWAIFTGIVKYFEQDKTAKQAVGE